MRRIFEVMIVAVAVVGLSSTAASANAKRVRRSAPAPLLGVDLYVRTSYPLATLSSEGSSDMSYLHTNLRAQAVGIVWNLVSPGNDSNSVATSPASLSPQGVARLTSLAKADRLKVQYRPIIRVGPESSWGDPAVSWEGHIVPSSPRTWFASLLRTERPYLRVAARMHVNQFVVGTELFGLGDSPWWRWFLRQVKSIYHGSVSYASQMTQYFAVPRRFPPVHEMGLDAYPTINLAASASSRAVTRAWERGIGVAPRSLLRRTTLDEVSIPAVDGAYRQPSNWNAGGRIDYQVQARWFSAACNTVAHFHMQGVYFYEVPLTAEPARPSSFPAFFSGRPAANSIRNCARTFAGTR